VFRGSAVQFIWYNQLESTISKLELPDFRVFKNDRPSDGLLPVEPSPEIQAHDLHETLRPVSDDESCIKANPISNISSKLQLQCTDASISQRTGRCCCCSIIVPLE